jgi:succinoglycan biosynthesis protein ExoW
MEMGAPPGGGGKESGVCAGLNMLHPHEHMAKPASEIAVIIPFYQVRSGILRRAVESALAQRDVATPHIVVVDDESPVDARSELADLLGAFPQHIEVIEQANAGPAAARNRGIRHVSGHVQFIAFLDSDDVWEPEHLKVARAALDAGADFYFCDSVRESGPTVFETKHFPDADCKLVSADLNVYRYCGDFPQLVLDRCPIATPAVVYRPSTLPFLFREDMKTAGEDYFFWLEVAYAGCATAISTRRNVKLGDGINIHAGVEWGTNAAVARAYFNQLLISHVRRQFRLTSLHESSCRRLTKRNRQYVAENVCSIVAHGRALDLGRFWRYVTLDPVILAALPWYLAKRARAYLSNWGALHWVGRKSK